MWNSCGGFPGDAATAAANLVSVVLVAAAMGGCADRILPPSPQTDVPIIESRTLGGHVKGTLSVLYSPYSVTNNLTVDASDTLAVQAGVVLQFADSTQLLVYGAVVCSGNRHNPVLFTSLQGPWKGIEIENSGKTSVFQFAIVESVDVASPATFSRKGALLVTGANVVIRNSVFRYDRSNEGGAIYLINSQSVIANCLVVNNYGFDNGGGILSWASSNELVNNTFVNNSCSNFGGALVIGYPTADVALNNVFFQNTSNLGNAAIAFSAADTTHYTAAYNFVQSYTADPVFVSPTDFHLAAGSPCIHAGDPGVQYDNTDGTRNNQGAYGGPGGDW